MTLNQPRVMVAGRVFDACREDVCVFCPAFLGDELCAHSCHAWGETNASSQAPAAPAPPAPPAAGAPSCPRCGGRQLLDALDEDWYCLPCGGRQVRPWEPGPDEEAHAAGKLRRRGPSHEGAKL